MQSKHLLYFSVALLAIWIATPLVHIGFAWLYGTVYTMNSELRGQFGDSFGLSTSLFSLLSFLAVLFVLLETQRQDSLKGRPFLIAEVSPLQVNKLEASSAESFSLGIKLRVRNYSDYLAHSVTISPKILYDNRERLCETIYVHKPVTQEGHEVNVSLLFSTRDDLFLLDKLSSRGNVTIMFDLIFRNALEEKFTSKNKYVAKVESRLELINALRAGIYTFDDWQAGFGVPIEFTEATDFVSGLAKK